MKKLLLPCFLVSSIVLTGCATIVSSTHQGVKVTSSDPAVNKELKLVANTDKFRVLKYPKVDSSMAIHRTSQPIEIRIEETECIEPSVETYDSSINGAIMLDFLATSLLSTSIDCSTGAAWAYDDTMVVHPKIKNTPECQKWHAELQEKYNKENPSNVTNDNTK